MRQLARYDAGGVHIARFSGASPRERHPTRDELIHVRHGGGGLRFIVEPGPATVVPKRVWHKQITPRGPSTVYRVTPEPSEGSFDEDPR